MTDNNNDENRTLDLPDDTSLPFFAYGIFKPGQLAYSKIKNNVNKDNIINTEINYEMRIRDGVPILTNTKGKYSRTKGTPITFKENQKKTAYKTISKTLLKKLYEWKTIRINEKEVNLLFGMNPDNGSNAIEDSRQRVNFDGKDDPLFNEAIKLIETNLDLKKNSHDIGSFFELQMNYMLLWSAIERYSSLIQ